MMGVARVVGDHTDGDAIGVQILEQVHDGVAIFGVEVARRLIGEKDQGIANESAGYGDTLLLTAGKLLGIVFGAVVHANTFERVLRFLFAFGGTNAAIVERQLDVFVDSEIANQIKGLKDKTDFAITDASAFGNLEIGNRLAV